MIRKFIVGNGRSEREVLVVGHLLVGRDPSCQISEPDPLLSRRHAEILFGAHGVSVRDLDSRNGVLVNGEKTRDQVLFPGDVVQMGHLLMRYLEEASDAAPVERRKDRHSPPDGTSAAAPSDRFKSDQGSPGRWTPEPTPLPGRRSSALPQGSTPRLKSITPVPRGRAAYEEATGTGLTPVPRDATDRRDVSVDRGEPENEIFASDATLLMSAGSLPADGFDLLPDRRADDTDLLLDSTRSAGDATFANAVANLAGIVGPGGESLQPGAGARLAVNPDLRVVDATAECAQLLDVPIGSLIGDSLADVFLRGVRRAYAEPDATMSFQVERGASGSIVVTLAMTRNAGAR